MRQRRVGRQGLDPETSASIKTTFLELIEELAQLTNDDNLVVAAVHNIFRQHHVTLTRTMAPVKLVTAARPVQRRIDKRSSCWA